MMIKDKYEVLEILGKGGSGIVYKVRELGLGRILAVKEVVCVTKTGEEEFMREVSIMKECFHPALPVVIDSFRTGGCAYLVMEYVEGVTLQEYMEKRGRLSVAQALELGFRIGEVLCYLHSRNQPIVYGDLKPENIMVTEQEKIRLLDFGTAGQENVSDATGCYGSLGYAAPEQRKGRAPALQSDIYAFGAVLHYMLTGENPGRPPYLRRRLRECDRALPIALERLVEKCLKEDMKKRYQSMETVQSDVQRIQRSRRKKEHPVRLLFQHTGRYTYRLEKNVWKTSKRGIGLFSGILFCLTAFVGISIGARADRGEKVLPVTIYDERGYKLCLKEEGVYDLQGAFRLEVPAACFTPGKVSELTIILSVPETEENQIRHFRICPKSSIEN